MPFPGTPPLPSLADPEKVPSQTQQNHMLKSTENRGQSKRFFHPERGTTNFCFVK